VEEFSVKHWDYFKYCVKELKIAPSEAWQLDLVEINYLSEQSDSEIDLTVMLNYERKLNGATQKWLDGGDVSQLKN